MPLTTGIAARAAELSFVHRLAMADAIVLATGHVVGVGVVTSDKVFETLKSTVTGVEIFRVARSGEGGSATAQNAQTIRTQIAADAQELAPGNIAVLYAERLDWAYLHERAADVPEETAALKQLRQEIDQILSGGGP